MPLLLEIISPEAKIYSQMVDSVVLPTTSGQIEILEGHIPLLTIIEAGELIINKEETASHLAINKGFAKITNSKVSLLVEAAINIQDIDIEELTIAHKNAKTALNEAKASSEMDSGHIENIESFIRFNLAQQNIKQHHSKEKKDS